LEDSEFVREQVTEAVTNLGLNRPELLGQYDYEVAKGFLALAIPEPLKEELRGAMYDWRTKRGIV
jgi:hypothetical protein